MTANSRFFAHIGRGRTKKVKGIEKQGLAAVELAAYQIRIRSVFWWYFYLMFTQDYRSNAGSAAVFG